MLKTLEGSLRAGFVSATGGDNNEVKLIAAAAVAAMFATPAFAEEFYVVQDTNRSAARSSPEARH